MNLLKKSIVDAGCRGPGICFAGQRSRQFPCQPAEPVSEELLGGDAVFEIGDGVAGDGLHGPFEFGGKALQEMEMLLGLSVSILNLIVYGCVCHRPDLV